jgi:aspartate aminotransferase
MFEQGAVLKARYGESSVFDFSLGNPSLDPPQAFSDALRRVVALEAKEKHGYPPNAGCSETREVVAGYLRREHGAAFTQDEILMTCGAGGALNVVLKALLNPGEEVIILAPYFVEYLFYTENHGGVAKIVPTRGDFSPDLGAIDSAISPLTKAIIINSPNNPTGRVYDSKTVVALGNLLKERSRKHGRQIYLLSDEPYGKILFDGIRLPSAFQAYDETVVVTSYSKDLSIPGERIGFIAIHPGSTHRSDLVEACIFCNRTLGFVNAPVLMQRVVAELQGVSVDVESYQRKRDLLCEILSQAGYRFVKPQGAFYVFPQTPVDDVLFVNELMERRILAVPGSGFGAPGHFRLAFCVEDNVIESSAPGFREVSRVFSGT